MRQSSSLHKTVQAARFRLKMSDASVELGETHHFCHTCCSSLYVTYLVQYAQLGSEMLQLPCPGDGVMQ